MILAETFKHELKGAKVVDQFEKKGTLVPTATFEFLTFQVGSHYYSISLEIGVPGYVISENESGSRDAAAINIPKLFLSNNKMKQYLKELILRNQEC